MSRSHSSRTAYDSSSVASACDNVPIPNSLQRSVQRSHIPHENAEDHVADPGHGENDLAASNIEGGNAVAANAVDGANIMAAGDAEQAYGQGFRVEDGHRFVQQGTLQAEPGTEENFSTNAGANALTSQSGDDAPATTLMVRNICRRVKQQQALRYWPCSVYNYDLFYLLYDYSKERGSGRIFINFVTHEDAIAFRDQFHGQLCPALCSVDQRDGNMKPLEIEAVRRQGFKATITHWLYTMPVDADPAMLPAIFLHGFRHDFWHYVENMLVEAPDAEPTLHLEFL